MRNKGFFWVLTILLTVVCLYQLSFTWYATREESKAQKEAAIRVESLKKEADSAGMVDLPNNTRVNITTAEGVELAKAAWINEILKDRGAKPVYPIFGSTFTEVKKRSLAFGLDLVGGMSVTMEISTGDLLKSHAQNPNSYQFTNTYRTAENQYNAGKGDFLDLFIAAAKSKKYKLGLLLKGDKIGVNSSDEEVEQYFQIGRAHV